MIVSTAFSGKRYAVLGLARSGLATVKALHASGALVTAWDRRPGPRDEVSGMATIADPLEIDLVGFDGVVVSPGVPLNTHPIAAKAREAGVPVIGDIELFAQARGDLPPHRVVGITGTNGKSTTTALIHHILKTAGVPTAMGGNIGLPILGQDPLPAGGVYVLELSSYQIDLTRSLDCDVAVLLNVTPDHLDRYESFEAYAQSKFRLIRMQSEDHSWVATDDPMVRKLDREAEDLVGPNGGDRSFPVSTADGDGFVSVFQGFAQTRSGRVGFQRNWPSLQGPHNAQNAAASIAVCRLLGIELNEISKGLRTFTGLPHRMERVATHNGVLFVNDSKATNTDSTAPALAAFPPQGNGPRIHWIVGGLPKEDGLGATEKHLANVKTAYTIGEAGPRFAELLEDRVPVVRSEMMCTAVQQALAAAAPGDVVLLSPACASFDQFKDYEARGDDFRRIVAGVTGCAPAAQAFAARSAA